MLVTKIYILIKSIKPITKNILKNATTVVVLTTHTQKGAHPEVGHAPWFLNRSSHQRCSMKKDVLKNFVKFTGKRLCQIPFFNKVNGLRPVTIKKDTLLQVFFCEF